MTPEELAIKHFPYTSSCPMKRKKIDWQRENLAKELKEHFIPLNGVTIPANASTSLCNSAKLVYTSKAELK